jgi:pyridoxal biosynthesis lyase PdxS
VFVGRGIFKSGDPTRRAEVSKDLGEPMVGRNMDELDVKLASRGA